MFALSNSTDTDQTFGRVVTAGERRAALGPPGRGAARYQDAIARVEDRTIVTPPVARIHAFRALDPRRSHALIDAMDLGGPHPARFLIRFSCDLPRLQRHFDPPHPAVSRRDRQ